MCSENLPFGDRRTVQATGPLLLQAGATNELIVGAVWVPNIDYPCPSITRLQFADDLAQALFDNCFDITDGPDAPDMFAVELDRQLILLLSNENDPFFIESNNAFEEYSEIDLQFVNPDTSLDSIYNFEGYKIYQLANPNVTVQELDNFEVSRLIRQVDVKNGVDEIWNWRAEANPINDTLATVFVPELQVDGADEGIRHSFNVQIDQFASGNDRRLINHRNYYFTVVAYGHNNYLNFDHVAPDGVDRGQDNPYLEGRRNVQAYTYTPRPIVYQDLNAAFGQEAQVTRITGRGTALNALDISDEQREALARGEGEVDDEFGTNIITYDIGNAPINATIVDPLGIKDADYRLEIAGEFNDANNVRALEPGARWNLTNISTGQVIASEKSIDELNEQIIYGEGFSISVNQVGNPGEMFNDENGAIAQAYEYEDPNENIWFDGVPGFGAEIVIDEDEDQFVTVFSYVEEGDLEDESNELSTIDEGLFIPFRTARWSDAGNYITPGWKGRQGFAIGQNNLSVTDLNNVDIVFTSDKSLWSECIVVESAVDEYVGQPFFTTNLTTENNGTNFALRNANSINQDGAEIEGTGKSYFPGYAIDVETGERLNIFFGENSVYRQEHDDLLKENFPNIEVNTAIGADMIWNPSTEFFVNGAFGAGGGPGGLGLYNDFAGGQHYIYVTRQPYDGCDALHSQLSAGGLFNTIRAVSFITWTGIPIPQQPLLSLADGLIPNELVAKLRVTRSFNRELVSDLVDPGADEAVGGLPVYDFSFSGVEATDIEQESVSSALDNVQVVPNPYYAYSSYEQTQFDNIVKVTNLPERAIVTIYTLDGKFIQQFNRDVSSAVSYTHLTLPTTPYV